MTPPSAHTLGPRPRPLPRPAGPCQDLALTATHLPLPPEPIQTTELIDHPRVPLAVVRRTDLPLADLPALMDEMFSHLPQALAAAGAAIIGPALALSSRMPSETCDIAVGFPVTVPLAAPVTLPTSSVVEAGELPARRVAMISHLGGHDGLYEAWGAFAGGLRADGAQPVAPFWEIYVTAPTPETDPATLRTDLVTSLA